MTAAVKGRISQSPIKVDLVPFSVDTKYGVSGSLEGGNVIYVTNLDDGESGMAGALARAKG